MIESIEIKNFRCFKDTKIAKFGLVNLIGGMNNAGKTALLEAVYFTASPVSQNILFMHQHIRTESAIFGEKMPANTWDNLFYQQNKNEVITFNLIGNVPWDNYKIALSCDEKTDEVFALRNNQLEHGFVNDIYTTLSNNRSIKSVLHVDKCADVDSEKNAICILAASEKGIIGHDIQPDLRSDKVYFIPSSMKLLSSYLALEYEKARFNGKKEAVLNAFKVIDKSIEHVEVFNIGEPILFLKRENENKMPLSLFGDAMNRVADFILKIVNNPNSILLIDEIENGIHFTAQAELWKMLFKLAIAYDTQIFATTHSFEMIKAFTKIAQDFSDKAAYFEMARSPKTNLIKAIRHDVDTLRFELDRNVAIRGE